MAISRMQMKRQLYMGGGIASLTPRQNYGFGSFVKSITKPITKIAQKIVPKEIAKPLAMVAPFLPPGYREAAYLAGTAKSKGRISPLDLAMVTIPNVRYTKGEGITGFGKYGEGESLGGIFEEKVAEPAREFISKPFEGLGEKISDFSISDLFKGTKTTFPEDMTEEAANKIIKNAANMEKLSKGAGTKYLESKGITLGKDALGKTLAKKAVVPAVLAGTSYYEAKKAEELAAQEEAQDTAQREAYDEDVAGYLERYRGMMVKDGGRIMKSVGDRVYPTDDESGVIYKDPEGKSITMEEFFRGTDEMEAADRPSNKMVPVPKPEEFLQRQKMREQLEQQKALEILENELEIKKMLDEAKETKKTKKVNRKNKALGGISDLETEEQVKVEGMPTGIKYQFDRTKTTDITPEEGQRLNDYFKRLLKEQGKEKKEEPTNKKMSSAYSPEDVEKMRRVIFSLTDNPDILVAPMDEVIQQYFDLESKKDGGRIGKMAGGDVMVPPVKRNMGGVMELDARQTGGFVPMGIKERADDVPAMLSKNEFVMTADAVRGMGGGDVDKGAAILQRIMKQAERVGKA